MNRSLRFVSKSKKRLTLLGAVSVALVAGVVAFAYWTTGGAGVGQAAVGTLATPMITAHSATGNAVSLTWSAVTPPGSGTVSYYALRDGGAARWQLRHRGITDHGSDVHRQRPQLELTDDLLVRRRRGLALVDVDERVGVATCEGRPDDHVHLYGAGECEGRRSDLYGHGDRRRFRQPGDVHIGHADRLHVERDGRRHHHLHRRSHLHDQRQPGRQRQLQRRATGATVVHGRQG